MLLNAVIFVSLGSIPAGGDIFILGMFYHRIRKRSSEAAMGRGRAAASRVNEPHGCIARPKPTSLYDYGVKSDVW